MTRTAWTLEEGVALAREVESVVRFYNAHVALGGGVLMKGTSTKDCDLIILPHCTGVAFNINIINGALERLGFRDIEPCDHSSNGDFKIVFRSTYQDRRVDLFYLQ